MPGDRKADGPGADRREDPAAYFKARPEFARIFAAMRKKWESLGRTAGKVTLAPATEEERRAMERFLGVPMPEDKITFTLPGFEQALKETRYGEISLKALLEAYFDAPLVGNQEKKQDKISREERFWERLERELGADVERGSGEDIGAEEAGREKSRTAEREALEWIREMRERKSGGYAVLMKEYRKSEEAARDLVWQVARCLRACRSADIWEHEPGDRDDHISGIRLAVLAAKVTKDPHALDRQTTAGTLLSHALCRRDGSAPPQNAREWKELYEKNGIWIDELSSTVIAYGIHLLVDGADAPRRPGEKDEPHRPDGADGSGRGLSLHPAYEGYCRRKEPCVVSLANLSCARGAYGDSPVIYIVENEMVFSELLERLSQYPVALLCTSGQPRTAAYQLMELLAENGHRFHYAGDMDPEGLAIAERIWRSFPQKVQVWRMGSGDYAKAISEETVSERRLEMLKDISHPELKKTAEQIIEHERAGYQELLLEEMVRDVKEALDRASKIARPRWGSSLGNLSSSSVLACILLSIS